MSNLKKPTFLCLHHTGLSHSKNPNQFYSNNNYHKALWQFKSSLGYYLGYNYEISKLGTVMQAREDGERTAACPQQQMNDGRCIHIVLDGNFNIEKPYPAQIYALRDLLRRLTKKHGINKDKIVFHNQFAQTSCPGTNLDLNFIKSLVSPNVIPVLEKEKTNLKNDILRAVDNLKNLINKL